MSPRRQYSNQLDPPWPPPTLPPEVIMSFDEVLAPPPVVGSPVDGAQAGGSAGGSGDADVAAPPTETPSVTPVRPELQFWERTLPQCAAADGRPRAFGFAKVTAGSSEMAAVKQHWDAGLHSGRPFEMLGCYRLQSTPLYRRFHLRRQEMQQALADDGLDGALLQVGFYWHGPSSLHALEGVIQGGFDRLYASNGVNALGVGTYFARLAELSASSYAADVSDMCAAGGSISVGGGAHGDSVCAILLCAVLYDEVARGEAQRFPPPRKPQSRTGVRYNTTGDCDFPAQGQGPPSILVTYHDGQALPLYVVTFRRH